MLDHGGIFHGTTLGEGATRREIVCRDDQGKARSKELAHAQKTTQTNSCPPALTHRLGAFGDCHADTDYSSTRCCYGVGPAEGSGMPRTRRWPYRPRIAQRLFPRGPAHVVRPGLIEIDARQLVTRLPGFVPVNCRLTQHRSMTLADYSPPATLPGAPGRAEPRSFLARCRYSVRFVLTPLLAPGCFPDSGESGYVGSGLREGCLAEIVTITRIGWRCCGSQDVARCVKDRQPQPYESQPGWRQARPPDQAE